MAALGYEYVELSHGIRITLVPGILRGVEEGIVKVSSTHNFCPLPTGAARRQQRHQLIGDLVDAGADIRRGDLIAAHANVTVPSTGIAPAAIVTSAAG
eukprot:gene37748-50959_t